ncbi:MAG TPA: fructosamine kinase family protein [Chitinophagaceae bacterium]
MDKSILGDISAKLSLSIKGMEPVSGGDINDTHVLDCGEVKLFLKSHLAAGRADMFSKELKGLELLRSAGAVRVPRPLLNDKSGDMIYLVMEFIEKAAVQPRTWNDFGEQLAALHRCTAPLFGLDHDNYIGSLPQLNKQAQDWASFYAAHRILPLVAKAFDEHKLGPADITAAEKLCNRLSELFPPEPPALLHGDLWSGNYLVAGGGEPVIFDPAVYYGHREMDLGMSLLFGGFQPQFYESYKNAWPPEPGWRKRTELTQLYPLLVHLLLFGGHYYQDVRTTIRKYS